MHACTLVCVSHTCNSRINTIGIKMHLHCILLTVSYITHDCNIHLHSGMQVAILRILNVEIVLLFQETYASWLAHTALNMTHKSIKDQAVLHPHLV